METHKIECLECPECHNKVLRFEVKKEKGKITEVSLITKTKPGIINSFESFLISDLLKEKIDLRCAYCEYVFVREIPFGDLLRSAFEFFGKEINDKENEEIKELWDKFLKQQIKNKLKKLQKTK